MQLTKWFVAQLYVNINKKENFTEKVFNEMMNLCSVEVSNVGIHLKKISPTINNENI